MGDKTTISGIPCGHCDEIQEEVYFASSSGALTHKCTKCGKENIIIESYWLKAATKEEVEEHYKRNGFE